MAIYELEERILFDGAIPADVADVQEQSSEDTESADVENNTADSADVSTTSGTENVSIAPDSAMTSSDSADTDDSDSDDETAESSQTSDSTSQSTADNSLSDLDIALDGLSDITFPDGYIPNPNIVLISSDHSELGEITDALNDGTILVEYNSDASFDSIIQQLRTELGDARPVNIAICDSDFDIDSSGASEFISDLNSIRTYDGEINVVSVGDNSIENYDVQTSDNGEVTIAEDADGNLSDYFDTDSLSALNPQSTSSEIVFINSSVMNAEEIVDDLPEGAEIVYLTRGEDGIQQITDYLAGKTDIDTIRIISHGNEGYFVLNGRVIDSQYLENNPELIASWGNSLSEDGDIMLYGCNLAASQEGQEFVQDLADLTGADIAAATFATGGSEAPLFTTESTEDLFFDSLSTTSTTFTESTSSSGQPVTDNLSPITSSSSGQPITDNLLPITSSNWSLDYQTGEIESAQLTVDGYEYHLANEIVTLNTDTNSGGGGTDGDLRYAIAQVGDGEEVTFNISDSDTVTILAELSISGKSMSIDGYNNATGNDVTVKVTMPGSASYAYRIFNIDASGETVNISNMTIQGGDISGSSANGGGILLTAGTLNLDAVTISDSKAYYGGGIYVDTSSILTITSSTISSNEASSSGGGIYFNSTSTATLSNCTISNNATVDSGGGGIFNMVGTATLSNCTISNNTASGNGSGIFNAGTLTVANTIIANNQDKDYFYQTGAGTFTDNGYNVVEYSNVAYNATGGFSNATSILYNQGSTLNSWTQGETTVSGSLGLSTTLELNGSTNGTMTLALASDSFAVDAIAYSVATNTWNNSVTEGTTIYTDQRGVTTDSPNPISIGAYSEYIGIYYMAKVDGDTNSGNWETTGVNNIWWTSTTGVADSYTTHATDITPTADNSDGIIIDTGFTVTVATGGFSINETTVNTTAKIIVADGQTLTVNNDDSGDDLTVAGTGIVDVIGTLQADGSQINYTGAGALNLTVSESVLNFNSGATVAGTGTFTNYGTVTSTGTTAISITAATIEAGNISGNNSDITLTSTSSFSLAAGKTITNITEGAADTLENPRWFWNSKYCR